MVSCLRVLGLLLAGGLVAVAAPLFANETGASGTAIAVAATRPPPPPEKPRSQFVFSLLPKSFQKHPSLDFHVITEMTPAGRKLPEPAPGHPVYYLEQAGKFTQLGHNAPANEHPPAAADLTRGMERALAESNYLPATPKTALPAIVVVFNYGSFARFSTDAYDFQQMSEMEDLFANADPSQATPGDFLQTGEDRDADSLLPIVLSTPEARTDVLQRAELIGGDKFAAELAKALNQEASYKQAQPAMGMPQIEATSPFHQFMNENASTMDLVEESFSSCYFVIASAYDYAAMRHGRRILLWRTKMTVNSMGISMGESLPSLVLSAGPYFGRDMTEPVTLSRKIDRQGEVKLGTPRVIDYSEAPASGAPTTRK
ncbi:MAG TPA: hypothetical protein VHE61_23960 [Opitutaceae bacterium]|nr:hypothetical protein [Opitutaceae bacterium]